MLLTVMSNPALRKFPQRTIAMAVPEIERSAPPDRRGQAGGPARIAGY
jgi:hypothetical protein